MPVPTDPELTPAPEPVSVPPIVPPNSGPPPSSEQTSGASEPQAGAAHGPDGEAETPDPPREFDPKYIEPFIGLVYVGALQETFEWAGHRFTIRTLRNDELIRVSMLVKEFLDSDGYTKAYQCAITAAALVDIDGKGVPTPVPIVSTPNQADLEARFRYVMENWFPPVPDVIYDHYIGLEVEVSRTLEAMGNRSG